MPASGSLAFASPGLGVPLTFLDADGCEVTEDLSSAWAHPIERLKPIRTLVQYKGQRNFTGEWWFATSREPVGYESWLERDHLMLLELRPGRRRRASQPFHLQLETVSGPRRHVPDYFVRERDSTGVVVDVRPDERVGEDAAVFDATAEAYAAVGWSYRRVGNPAAVLTANVRWLAGYRHDSCSRPDVRASALDAVRHPITLGQLTSRLGEPVVTVPTLFHVLGAHELAADLRAQRLSMNTLVWTAS